MNQNISEKFSLFIAFILDRVIFRTRNQDSIHISMYVESSWANETNLLLFNQSWIFKSFQWCVKSGCAELQPITARHFVKCYALIGGKLAHPDSAHHWNDLKIQLKFTPTPRIHNCTVCDINICTWLTKEDR